MPLSLCGLSQCLRFSTRTCLRNPKYLPTTHPWNTEVHYHIPVIYHSDCSPTLLPVQVNLPSFSSLHPPPSLPLPPPAFQRQCMPHNAHSPLPYSQLLRTILEVKFSLENIKNFSSPFTWASSISSSLGTWISLHHWLLGASHFWSLFASSGSSRSLALAWRNVNLEPGVLNRHAKQLLDPILSLFFFFLFVL